MEIHLKTGVYRVVQGTFRLQGSDLKMQIALALKRWLQNQPSQNRPPKHIHKCSMCVQNLMPFCLNDQ